MQRLDWTHLGEAGRQAALARPGGRSDPALLTQVRAIVEGVRDGGWETLVEIAERIDGVAPVPIEVAPAAAAARDELPVEAIEAITLAYRNVTEFHLGSMPKDLAIETMPGLTVRKLWRAMDRVGIYVPGGKTPLFSSLLMLAVPARVAGVGEIVCVTPPQTGGGIDPAIAVAADLCGIATIWTVGGAQAIAALAFGAGGIPAVAKICGPGNAWVAEGKTLVSSIGGGPAIDMPAGPSELLVIADGAADPRLVAADLLSQAEHDAAAQVILVTTSAELADQVATEIDRQLARLPRADIACASLRNARSILCGTLDEAVEIANAYAPEHLALAVENFDALVPNIRNAGAVFAGGMAAESFGDYLAGSSHVLPTDGAARAYGGISCHSFLKAMTVQSLDREVAVRLAGPTATLARLEGLEAHARAAEMRAEVA